MNILVSFCNSPRIPGWPVVGLLEADTGRFQIIQRPGEIPRCAGISGLGASREHLYVIMQEPAWLLVFRLDNLSLLERYEFRSAVDPHSLWVTDEALYVVSTGTDEVLQLRTEGATVISEQVYWRSEPGARRADLCHLNSVCGWRGDLLVSGFGKKSGPRWGSALDGFILNLTQDRVMATGIQQPHSLLPLGETLAYCESRTKQVHVWDQARSPRLPGYTRGLCVAGGKLFAGTSARRQISKSTGVRNDPADPDSPAERCTVTRLSLDHLETEEIFDLTEYGREIYDLLPVGDTHAWPLGGEEQFRPSDADWWRQADLALQEVAQVVPPEESFILVDQDEWGPEAMPGRHAIPFTERDGQYCGPPANDEIGIQELERLRQAGARFAVFCWPAFWWLDYYAGLHRHLRASSRRVLENDRLVVFDLQP